MYGDRLTELRKDKGWTQEYLGQLICVDKNTISAYETDRRQPSTETIVTFSKLFHVSTDYLLGITKEPKPFRFSEKGILLADHIPDEVRAEFTEILDYLIFKHNDKKGTNK